MNPSHKKSSLWGFKKNHTVHCESLVREYALQFKRELIQFMILLSQDGLNLSNVTIKTPISINGVHQLIPETMFPQKIISRTTVFDIDNNNKCYFNTTSAY